MQNGQLAKFLGGSPKDVFFKLIIMSLIVGILLAWWGYNPYNLLHSIENLFYYFWNAGFEFFYGLWRYLALGAVVVIPLWLIMRLLGVFSQKPLLDVKITAKINSQETKKGIEDPKTN
jgi:Family of unknown function (DUF6460)